MAIGSPPLRRMLSMNSTAPHHGAGSRVPDTWELPARLTGTIVQVLLCRH